MALVPQAEELDESNMQVASPGFHVIFLPFSEDFRTLHFEESPKGVLVALSWCTNMHVCVAIVCELQLPNVMVLQYFSTRGACTYICTCSM